MILLAFPLVFELAIVMAMQGLLSEMDTETRRLEDMRGFANRVYSILALNQERMYVSIANHKLPSEALQSRVLQLKQRMHDKLIEAEQFSHRSPELSNRYNEIKHAADLIENDIKSFFTNYKEGHSAETAAAWFKVTRTLEEFRVYGDLIATDESEISRQVTAKLQNQKITLQCILWFAFASNISMAAAIAWYFNQQNQKRLKTVVANTRRLAANKPLTERLSGNDDLAEVDGTIARLHANLAEMRSRERAILENAADIICAIDDNLMLTDINKAGERLLDSSADDLLGRRVVSLVAEADRVNVAARLEALKMGDGEMAETFEAAMALRQLEWRVTYSQRQRSFYCVLHDVSAQKELEQLKNDFIAMITHDLRAPLSSIKMIHEALGDGLYGDLNDKGQAAVARADSGLSRLMHLVNNLLDFERLDSGALTLYREPVPVAKMLSQAANTVHDLDQAKHIEIKTIVDLAPQQTIDADNERLGQVLVNLLSNAIKFSPDGSTIRLCARQQTTGLLIEVIDQGRGIAKEKQAEIFQKFKQTSHADASNMRGSGLGLAIAKKIVDLHGGRIGVESDIGAGSRFYVYI